MALRLLIRQGFCRTIQKTTRLCCWASHESWFYCRTMFLRRIGQILREDVTLLASFTDPQVRPYFLSAEERGSTGSPILDYQVLPAIRKSSVGSAAFTLMIMLAERARFITFAGPPLIPEPQGLKKRDSSPCEVSGICCSGIGTAETG